MQDIQNVWNKKILNQVANLDKPWFSPAIQIISSLKLDQPVIIEVGCGMGELASIIKNSNLSVGKYIGLDGNSERANTTAEQGFDVRIANFEEEIPIEAQIADLVVSLEVIEHIADAENFLKEIHKVLKPGGKLVISTPNIGFIVHRLNFLFSAKIHQEGIHLRFFNRKMLLKILSNTGFKLIEQKSIMPLWGFNTINARLLGRKREFIGCSSSVEWLLASNFIWLLEKI